MSICPECEGSGELPGVGDNNEDLVCPECDGSGDQQEEEDAEK